MSKGTAYVLGSDDAEIARLDGQASSIAGATEALLRAAGIGGPMRVLDLGTGLGHVAFQVAELLDPDGSVLGVDQAEQLLEIAERGRVAADIEDVEFRPGRRAVVQGKRAVRRDRRAPAAVPPARTRGGPAAPARRAAPRRHHGLGRIRHRRHACGAGAVILPPAVVGS
jgi:Methyltransferase domain